MSTANRMTKGEQSDLLKLVRQRERLAKTMAAERKAELIADFEQQLGTIFKYDDDAVWKQATELAMKTVRDAQAQIASRCEELGIPKDFAPSIDMDWYGRGQTRSRERRAELRKMGISRLDAIEKSALTEVVKRSVQAQTEIVTHGLESPTAKAFLEGMGTVEALMPAIDINILLVERRAHAAR